jgi:hypothetical protein
MKALLLVTALLSWHANAYAWGDDGHRITGQIANGLLTDNARSEVRRLLGSDDLSLVATWMDDERDTLNQRLPGSSRWHYENREACGKAISVRTCPRGQCLTKQLERSLRESGNKKLEDKQRAESLRIAIHLLGDLHQPLHLVDNYDRGGNDTWVQLPRDKQPRRLHEVWDTRLLRLSLGRASTKKSAEYAEALTDRFATQSKEWQLGDVEQWASDTHQLGIDMYRQLPTFSCRTAQTANEPNAMILPASYIESARSIVDLQLAKAGVRLAAELNKTFAAKTP